MKKIKIYCEKCGKEVLCNRVLNKRDDCPFSERKRDLSKPLMGVLPFKDGKTYYCTCFECWQEVNNLSDKEMFGLRCWEGLENKILALRSPSKRTFQI